MGKSLKPLFLATATFGGVYGLSQRAQALEQSEHCYSAPEISAAMKDEEQLLVAVAFEAVRGGAIVGHGAAAFCGCVAA